MAVTLTVRQGEVLRWIEEFIDARGYPPTGRELADGCGLGGSSGAHRMLQGLAHKGFLESSSSRSRAIKLAEPVVDLTDLSVGDRGRMALLGRSHLAIARANLEVSIEHDTAPSVQQQLLAQSLRRLGRGHALVSASGEAGPTAIAGDAGIGRLLDRLLPASAAGLLPYLGHKLLFSRLVAVTLKTTAQRHPTLRALLWADMRIYDRAVRVTRDCLLATCAPRTRHVTAPDLVEPARQLVDAMFDISSVVDDAYGRGAMSMYGMSPRLVLEETARCLP